MTNEAMAIVWLLWPIYVHPEADLVIYIAVYLRAMVLKNFF